MNTKTILFSALSTILATSTAIAGHPVIYRIETTKAEQTVHHFGASDAWSMQFAGLWPEAQQNQVADWLFSTDNDTNGQPKGIGLSVWRFNLGAGSVEQGDAAQIQPSTRTECLMRQDGTWDWSRQQGQRHFLHLAKERGVPHFLAFMNSAPVYFTANGLATNTGRGSFINLRSDQYGAFASFAANALKGIEAHDGIHFDYFCPVNEPDGSWDWLGPKQEGSPATNREVAKVVKAMSRAFKKQRLSTKIMFNESSDLRCLFGLHDAGWQRGREVPAFFTKDSTDTYVGDCYGTMPVIMAHSYWTNTPVSYMRQAREALRDSLRRYGVEYWQTELCVMGNDEEIGGGSHYDFSMLTGLYIARVIHHDLVYGNAASWSWWRSMGGDYRDGLIRVFSDDNWKTGRALPSKLMWCLGNYSRFVRPEAVRYDITALDKDGKTVKDGDTEPYGIMASAYKNTDGSWIVVAINYSEATRLFRLEGVEGTWRMYRTSDAEGESLKPVGTTTGNTSLMPKSITTFVCGK
ncbi:glycoside hydrolase [Hallella multisaccharivorax]|uniref:glycoside hydrolase n=1 Tax=Hallella multisaccharivorax TaxID=310514 RepID=UPI0036217806